MPRKMKKPEDGQAIPEMVDCLSREEARRMFKDGKLTAHGREMAKIQDRVLPPEKVDEWGFLLSRKEREAIKRKGDDKVERRASFRPAWSWSLGWVAGLWQNRAEGREK